MSFGVFGAFDGGELLMHALAILAVALFVRLGDWIFRRLLSMPERVGWGIFTCTGFTAIAYAFLYDSELLREFDTKGVLLVWGFGLLAAQAMGAFRGRACRPAPPRRWVRGTRIL